jgi:hypothetical protein
MCSFTEADLKLYPTIVRYDSAYAILFKCSKRRIADYPHLSRWLRDIFNITVGAPSGMQVGRRTDRQTDGQSAGWTEGRTGIGYECVL